MNALKYLLSTRSLVALATTKELNIQTGLSRHGRTSIQTFEMAMGRKVDSLLEKNCSNC